jgi:predicted nucleic acid-binding protein
MIDRVVVDSSVAIKWFVEEPYSVEAHRLLEGYQDGTLTLLAPDLMYAEVGNIVWKKHCSRAWQQKMPQRSSRLFAP